MGASLPHPWRGLGNEQSHFGLVIVQRVEVGEFAKRRIRLQLLLLLAAFIGFGLAPGCGGGSSTGPPPPISHTYAITVSATSGSLQEATTLTLTGESPSAIQYP
jgi:hypothetical protein